MNSSHESEVLPQNASITQLTSTSHENEVSIVAKFGWIEIKATEGIELNYLDTFLKNNNGSTIDYRKLEIPKSDPSPVKDKDISFDLASMHTRLSKWGGLNMGSKKEKNKELNYDLEDSFIDDNEGNISGIQNAGFVESAFEDFICVRGGMQAFKASNYYLDRVKTIKQSLVEVTKKKKPKEPKEAKEHKEPKEPKEPKKKVVKSASSGEKAKEFKEPKEPKKKVPGANKRKKSSGVGIERPANEEKRVKETKEPSEEDNDPNGAKLIHIDLGLGNSEFK